MLIEAARRAEAAAKEMLSLVNEGSASCAEMREMLAVLKATVSVLSVAQTSAAASIAGVERHGDGGAEVLAESAGLSRREAHSQVKTARVIETVPAVRDAMESGRLSMTNAKRLAEAVEKTDAEAVQADEDLLAKAESMRPEQFAREARRWAVDRQGDGGASEHARQRARRCVRVWDSDDGLVHLHGQFDTVTGKRIANRLRDEAARLYEDDKKAAKNGDADRCSFDQCMADALDNLTSSAGAGGGKSFADICVVAHVDDSTGELIAELPDGVRLPRAVLEELACNAKLTGAIYDRTGKPIWRTESRRTVTKAQWQLLIARWGGCFHCGANPGICQAHHIEPASRGGPTKLANLVPACWTCHHRIHHDGWQIHKSPDGRHTLHPPDRVSYGPAYAPEEAPRLRPAARWTPDPLPLPEPDSEEILGSTPMPVGSHRNGTGRTHRSHERPRSGPEVARAALRTARAKRTAPGAARTARAEPSPPESEADGSPGLQEELRSHLR